MENEHIARAVLNLLLGCIRAQVFLYLSQNYAGDNICSFIYATCLHRLLNKHNKCKYGQ